MKDAIPKFEPDRLPEKGAIFSACRKHRFVLWRKWGESGRFVHFIGLNPSTADDTSDDPTIRRCRQFANSWGCDGLFITNLFSFMTAFPAELRKVEFPLLGENDAYIKSLAEHCPMTVLIWGNDGCFQDRNEQVLNWIDTPRCVKINKTGQPAHPLYLPKHLKTIPFF